MSAGRGGWGNVQVKSPGNVQEMSRGNILHSSVQFISFTAFHRSLLWVATGPPGLQNTKQRANKNFHDNDSRTCAHCVSLQQTLTKVANVQQCYRK